MQSSSAKVRECYGSCRVRNGLRRTFNFLVCDLHVDVGIHSGGAELHGYVNHERHATFVSTRWCSKCERFLLQLHNWVTVGMKAETPVGIDIHNVLGYIFLLFAKSVSHAVASSANVRERYGSCRVCHGLGWAFNFLVCNFHVDVSIDSRGAELHRDVNNERHATFVSTRRWSKCERFLLQLHNGITVGMKAETSVGIDIHNVLGHIFLLLAKSVSHAIASSANVRECYGSCRVCHGLGWTLNFLVCDLHVDVSIHSGRAELHGDVNDERHATFIS